MTSNGPVGDLVEIGGPVPGTANLAAGINGRGQVAGTAIPSGPSAIVPQAFLWTPDTPNGNTGSAKLEPDLLYRVSRADCLGRTGDFSTEAQEWFIGKARALSVENNPPAPFLMGRHLLEMGLRPGPAIGRITRAVYEMQLDGRVTSLDEARREALRLIEAERADGMLS